MTDDLGFLDLLREHHLLRDTGRLGIELLDELGHHFLIGGVFRSFQNKILAPDQFAAADEENLHAGFVIGACHGDDIRILVIRRKDHLLAFNDGLHGLQPVAQGGGAFKLELLGSLFHFLLDTLHDRFGVTVQEFLQVGDHLAVLRLVDRADAGRQAELDIVIKTGALVLAGDFPVTGQVRKDPPQHIQSLVDGPGGCIWAEIACAVLLHQACHGDFGKWLIPMDFDVGVTFVVLQADVVLGTVFLDQVHLEDERLEFGPDQDPFDMGDLAHQAAGLVVVAGIRVEI